MAKWKPVNWRLFRARQRNERELWRVEQHLQGNDPDVEMLRAEVMGLDSVLRARLRQKQHDGGGR